MIKDLLKSNARRYPDKTAIVFEDTRYTYKEFNDRVNRLANGLVNLGFKKGDWIAIVADDCIQQVEVFWAGAKAGIATSSLNPNSSKRDFLHLIGNGKARAVVCSQKHLNLVKSLRPELEGVKEFIVIGPAEKGFTGYEDLTSNSSSLEPNVEISEDDLLYFGNTSGTTGLSKQPMHTHNSLFSEALMDLDALNYDMSAGGAFLVAVPLFAAIVLPRVSILSFYMRCPLVIPSDLAPQ
ncbi:MAG: AMP-binding protein, partial [Pseudomonadota bacterium]